MQVFLSRWALQTFLIELPKQEKFSWAEFHCVGKVAFLAKAAIPG